MIRPAPIERLPQPMRETRLRMLVDELRYERDGLRAHVKSLSGQVERKNLRLAAMRAEQADLRRQLAHAVKELARGAR